MQANWDLFFQRVLKDEGTTFTDDPSDNGGPTKCGITITDVARYYGLKLKFKKGKFVRGKGDWNKALQLTKDLDPGKASDIYKKFYWDACRADDLPSGVDYMVVDYSVNSGIGRALGTTLCPLVGVKPAVNTVTDAVLTKVNTYGKTIDLINHYQDARKAFLIAISNPNDPDYAHNYKYRDGWLARVQRVRDVALKLAAEAPVQAPVPVAQRAPKAMTAPTTPPPSKVKVAATSKPVWHTLTGGASLLVAKSAAAVHAVGATIMAGFAAFPAIVSSSRDTRQAFTDLGLFAGSDTFVVGGFSLVGVICLGLAIWHFATSEQSNSEQSVPQPA